MNASPVDGLPVGPHREYEHFFSARAAVRSGFEIARPVEIGNQPGLFRLPSQQFPIDLCPEIQRDGWGVTHGIPDALANVAGWGQAGEFQRSHFRHCPVARLRIRKRLQYSLQKGHELFATAI
jgi:hypothetical protein